MDKFGAYILGDIEESAYFRHIILIKLMFKKAISILLIPVILVFSSGITVFAEHCGMRKTPTYSLSVEQSCCCSKEVHEKCCHQTKVEIKKIKDSFSTSSSTPLPLIQFSSFIFPVSQSISIFSYFTAVNDYTQDHAPTEPPLSYCLLFRSLLI